MNSCSLGLIDETIKIHEIETVILFLVRGLCICMEGRWMILLFHTLECLMTEFTKYLCRTKRLHIQGFWQEHHCEPGFRSCANITLSHTYIRHFCTVQSIIITNFAEKNIFIPNQKCKMSLQVITLNYALKIWNLFYNSK